MNLLRTSRPRFWFYLFGPYLLGAATLLSTTLSPATILSLVIFGLYFLFPANLLIYGVNDIFDYETDILNDKKRGYETVTRPDERKRLAAFIVATNIPFIILSPFFLPGIGVLGLLAFLFFGLSYSMPPIRAKTKPFVDAAFNVLYVFPGLVSLSFHGLPPWPLFLAATFWCMAMHAYSAVPDIKADAEAGLSTIATKLGAEKTLLFCLVLYVISAALSFPFIDGLAVVFGLGYGALMLFSLRRIRQGHSIMHIYKRFPLINMVVGFLLTLFILCRTIL